jgi:hypothetical protein
VIALAAALRLAAPGGTPLDPFYDPAVRSIGHVVARVLRRRLRAVRGAGDRQAAGRSVVQVASTKVLGFSAFALLLVVVADLRSNLDVREPHGTLRAPASRGAGTAAARVAIRASASAIRHPRPNAVFAPSGVIRIISGR